MGSRYLPFADVVTEDLSLTRLLRLSLFQVSVGMALVLLVGTLNRVMIVELGVATSLVAFMLAMPLLFAPFRALIGYRSDKHRCALGWRRVPFIWNGSLMQFGGFSIMPFALLVLGGQGEAADAPAWIGQIAAAAAFLLAGAGVHTVQTAGLALATDLTPRESHARVVGLMYVSLLAGMLVSALLFGVLLENFSPGRLVQVVQGTAVLTLVLNSIAMWKQETRHSRPVNDSEEDLSFSEAFRHFCSGEHAKQRLIVVGIGTLAFGMAEVILEPFGGQVLDFSVSATTKLTALLALGGLIGFAYASRVLGNGGNPYRVSGTGIAVGLPAFILVVLSGTFNLPMLFLLGNLMIGFAAAVFGHGTLTATMYSAPKSQSGLALGSWGAVQATAAGLGIALSGALRDIVTLFTSSGHAVSEATIKATTNATTATEISPSGYYAVYLVEILLLLVTFIALVPLLRSSNRFFTQHVYTNQNAKSAEASQ